MNIILKFLVVIGLGIALHGVYTLVILSVNSHKETKNVRYCIDTPDNFTVCCDEYKKGESIPRLTKCNSLFAKEYINPTNIRVEEK